MEPLRNDLKIATNARRPASDNQEQKAAWIVNADVPKRKRKWAEKMFVIRKEQAILRDGARPRYDKHL